MSSYMVLLCVITCLVTLLLLCRKKMKSKYVEPPNYPGALPFVGHAYMLLGNTVSIWETLQKFSNYTLKVDGMVKFNILSQQFYVITDPDDFVTVTTTCLEKAPIYNTAKDWVGNGLLTSEVSLWKKNRKLFSPAFTQRAITQYLEVFNNQSRRLVEQLSFEVDKGKFNQYEYLLNNIMELISHTTTGMKNEDKNLVNINYVYQVDSILEMIIERYQKFWLFLPFWYNRSDVKRRQDMVANNTKSLMYTVINKRRAELQGTEKENKNKVVLDYILENLDDKETELNDDIRVHLETFLMTTFDTTSGTLVFVLKLIGTYPKVQEQILKELDEIFGKSDRDVDKDDLPKLKYMEAVIKETLRLYPVVPGISRTSQHEVKLKNYTIPGGNTLVCSIHALHHHPVWGKDVEEFRPERWLDPNIPPEGYFVAFSKGRRNCIGELYAWMVMKITLVHILRRYFVFADNTKLVLKYNALMKPVSGYEISIKLRS